MWIKRAPVRNIHVLCIFCILSVCMCYKRVAISNGQLIPFDKKVLFVHTKDAELYIHHVEIKNNQLQGIVSFIVPDHKQKEDIHVYLDSTVVIPIIQDERVSIDIAAIEKVEGYSFDSDRAALGWFAGGISGCLIGGSFLVYVFWSIINSVFEFRI